MRGPILIIDGLNTFLRSWTVVPQMSTNGEAVGGTIGFLRSLKACIRDFQPNTVVVVWDGKGGSQRKRGLYADYKAGRKPRVNRAYDNETADESYANLRTQYAMLVRYLEDLGIPQVEVEGIEADDAIGYLCRQRWGDSDKVVVSTDKDFLQLIDDRTRVHSPSKKKTYTPSVFHEEYGIRPDNYIFMKALVGDPSDNIKGITGFGPKTVTKLLPLLDERECSAQDVLDAARANPTKSKKLEAVVAGADVFIGNIRLMELTNVSISAQSTRAIDWSVGIAGGREHPAPNLSAVRLSLLRDGIQITDHDFFSTFEAYHARRRSDGGNEKG